MITCVPQQVLFRPPRPQRQCGHVQNLHVLWCYSHIVFDARCQADATRGALGTSRPLRCEAVEAVWKVDR